MIIQNKKINFLGDSITEGGNATRPENIYVEVVARIGNLAEARNYGVGGTCIAARKTPFEEAVLNEYWSEDFVTRALRMDKDADAVVVFGGTNDYGHGDVPIGDVVDYGDTFCGALNRLLDILQARFPVPVLFVTPIPRRDVTGPFGEYRRSFATGTLSDYVSAIKNVAQLHNVGVLDLFSDKDFVSDCNFKELVSEDNLHPTDKGHALIAQKIVERLQKM